MSGLPVLEEMHPVCVSCRDCGESFLAYAVTATGKHRTRCDRCCQTVGEPKITVPPTDFERARKIAALRRKSFPERASGFFCEWTDVVARIFVIGFFLGVLGVSIRGLFWLGEAVAWFASAI